jgi:hypothetical protein
MRPKSGHCSVPELLALVALVASCSPVEAEVGAGWPPSDAGDAGFTFFTDFASNGPPWVMRAQANGRTDFGVADTSSGDQKVAELRFPGRTGVAPTDWVGPMFATEIASAMRLHFGSYRSSLSVPRCPSDQDVIGAMFVYSNSGSDANHNGIADNDEIDVQFLCSAPSAIYLTIWTDYQLNDAGQPVFIKLRHIVDFATGDIYDTLSDMANGSTKTGNDPLFLRPGFPAASAFYEVGFDWHADSVRFFIVMDGVELTLWTLGDAAHIPQSSAPIMFNMWHPSEHWPPRSGPALYPADDVVMRLDWFGYRAE